MIVYHVKHPLCHHNPDYPTLSVVIPAYNEATGIASTLKSLCNQDTIDFELIVVDNNSNDTTAAIAAQYGARVVREQRQGIAHARQAGFLAAHGEIIATTDADTLVPPDWVSRIIKQFKQRNDIVAYGGLYRLHSGPWTARLIFPKFAYAVWVLDRWRRGNWSLPGANMAIRAQAFQAIGGFATHLQIGEDVEISQRLSSIGIVRFDREFLVSTSGRRYREGLLRGAWAYRSILTGGYKKETQFASIRDGSMYE